MKQATDRDGKSKTASAVDVEHYPEQHEVTNGHMGSDGFDDTFDHGQVAERAYELWVLRGCPDGSAEQNWFDAEEELRAQKASQSTRKVNNPTGTVQR